MAKILKTMSCLELRMQRASATSTNSKNGQFFKENYQKFPKMAKILNTYLELRMQRASATCTNSSGSKF
jgi:hypothetical protein